jgi:hypothetical protein
MSGELSFAERISKNNSYYDRFAQHVAKRTENRDYTEKWIETSTWGRPCEWISMVLVG